jgi:Mn-dependent DtxR family transcriptional regulator
LSFFIPFSFLALVKIAKLNFLNEHAIIKLNMYIKEFSYMKNNESAENYLETILILSKKLPVVRSVDIANELGFKKSSVSIAMKNLRKKNQITVTDAGFIYLTEEGKAIAEMIYERHELLSTWLTKLGVPSNIASQDACRMEHVISKESFEAIKKHVQVKNKLSF